MTLSVGDILVNRYRIVKLVGQGGFGAVYRGWDLSLKVPVAVKENLDTTAEAQHQFEQEAQLLAPLRHPNLPRVSDHFFVPGQGQYLVMDFVEGQSLAEILAARGGPLSEAEALPWINQVCDALEYLHTRTPPIIHRDIKPQNIIVAADGRAVLVDFGISKAYDPSLTTTRGARAVTPGYSPPEQYGMGKTDARSDVYALGATLYALLTGQAPLESVTLITGMEKLLPVRQANPGVSARTEAAIAAAMALSSSQRLSNATALRNALSGRMVASPVAAPSPAPEQGGRRGAQVLAWLGLVAIVAVVGLVAVFLLRDRGPKPGTATPSGGTAIAEETSVAVVAPATEPQSTAPPVVAAASQATKTAEPTVTLPPATATPANQRIQTLPGGIDVPQVLVPAGAFMMGADDGNAADGTDDEAPIHEVRLDAFWLDKTEVTNAQFTAFTADTGYVTTDELDGIGYTIAGSEFDDVRGANWRHPLGPNSDIIGQDDYPVTLVAYDDARAYCAWAGGRLPTEAEWEYAARGPSAPLYPWGDVFSEQRVNACDRNCPMNWAEDAIDDGYTFAAAVGTFGGGVSWAGAEDMAGNAWEWTADWYAADYYANSPVDNPTGPSGKVDEDGKSVRGGAWSSTMQGVRSTTRVSVGAWRGHFDVGVRCVYDVAPISALPLVDETPAPSPLAAGSTREATDPTGETVTHVYVPAGSFQMGSEDGNNDERPIHDVTIDAFWLDRTEVSNDRFAAFVAAEGYETAAERQGWGYLFDGGNWDVVNGADWQHPQGPGSDIDGLGDYPVVLVNRADAAAFCAWAGGRLPTEAEWEYAARGPENHLWAWGDEFLTDRVNFCDHDCSASWVTLDVDDGYPYTAPVDSFPQGASWVGALNITGNVWEWVADWYDATYYAHSPQANPPGPESGERGLLRGGSWVFEPRRLRATDRNSTDPDYAINEFGVRCAYNIDTGS